MGALTERNGVPLDISRRSPLSADVPVESRRQRPGVLQKIGKIPHRFAHRQVPLSSLFALFATVLVSLEVLFFLRHGQPPFNDEVSASIGTFRDLR